MNKILIVILLFSYSLFLTMCSKDPVQSENTSTEWETVFFDDFNRGNTNDGDLGDNWIVCKTAQGQTMRIKDEEIYAEREIPPVGAAETCPYALFIEGFDHTVMRISMKARTASNPNDPVFLLFAGADALIDTGYFAGYRYDAFYEETPTSINIASYEIAANTAYFIRLTVFEQGFLWEINDYTSGELLFYGGTNDEVFISGRIGFMAGAPSPAAVYIDDFRIEVAK